MTPCEHKWGVRAESGDWSCADCGNAFQAPTHKGEQMISTEPPTTPSDGDAASSERLASLVQRLRWEAKGWDAAAHTVTGPAIAALYREAAMRIESQERALEAADDMEKLQPVGRFPHDTPRGAITPIAWAVLVYRASRAALTRGEATGSSQPPPDSAGSDNP